MPAFWLDMIAGVSAFIVKSKKLLLTMGIIKSIVMLLVILALEILLALLSIPLYLTQDYLKNPALFNREGFSYSAYQVRKRITIATVIGVVFFWICYGAFTWYEVRHAPGSLATSNSISFTDTTTLYYDSNFIRIGGGVAALVTSTGGPVVLADTNNTAGQFASGAHTNTIWSSASSSVQLSDSNTIGNFTSRIMDAGATSTWQTLAWTPRAPYAKELPDGGTSETAYADGNMNMTGLVALWHFNEAGYNGTTGEVIDSSGNGYHATTVNGAGTTSTAMFNRAGNFVYASTTYARVATSSFQSTSQSGTVMMWVRPGAMTGNFRGLLMAGDEDATAQRLMFGLHRDTQTATVYHLQSGGQQDFIGAGNTIMVTNTWHHVVWESDGSQYSIYVDGVAQSLSVVLGAGANSGDWFGDLTGTDNIILGARRNSSALEGFSGQIDDVAVFNRILTPAEILSAYRRGAGTLKYQVRSCDDAACSGESFIGPTGTSTSYYSESTTTTVGLPVKTLIGVPDNRYFQYQAFVSTTDATLLATPELFTVTTTATVTSTYPTSSPAIVSGVGVPFGNIDGLTESLGSNNAGTVKYQLGFNNTSTWYYWNSSTWAVATTSATEANTAAEINSHVLTFDDVVGQGLVYLRAFFVSSGSQAVELSSVILTTTSTVSLSVASSTVNENVGSTSITFVLDRVSSSTVTVDYSATGGTAASSSDYTLVNGTATITAGSTTTTLDIPITDDHTAEGTETIIVSLSNPGGAVLDATTTQTISILDNDSPGVTVTESDSATAVTEGGTTDTYTIVLNTQPTNIVTVAVVTSTKDATISTTSIRFTTSNWNTPITVTVTADDDAIAKGTRHMTISHTASSTDTNYNGVSVVSVAVTVTDNETPGVTVTESGGNTTLAESSTTTDSYTLVLTSQPTSTVTITLATSSPDMTLSTTSIHITPNNWNTPVTVTVSAVDDAIAEGTETSTISHTVSSIDAGYNGISVNTVAVQVTDNDTAGVSVTESDGVTDVSETGPTSDTYTIVLVTEPTATVMMTLSTTTGGIMVSPTVLHFSTSNWNVPQTVTVTAIDDSTYEGIHGATITHAVSSADSQYSGIGVSSVEVDITDNDSITVTAPSNTTVNTLAPTALVVPLTSVPPSNMTVTSGGGDSGVLITNTTVVPSNAIFTRSRTVQLAIPGDPSVRRMAIAYDPTFDHASQEPYASHKQWDLCAGRTRCRDGVYLVFMRVYTEFGVPSATITRAYLLDLATSTPSAGVSPARAALVARGVQVMPFTAVTTAGGRNNEVRELQHLLLYLGFFPTDQVVTGYYGDKTTSAVRQYQAANNLVVSGQVDAATRQSLNKLLGF